MRGFNSENYVITGLENVSGLTWNRSATVKAHGPYPYHSLICILKGSRELTTDAKANLSARTGSILLLPQGTVYTVDRGEETEGMIVNFMAECNACTPFAYTVSNFSKWQALFASLQSIWLHSKPGSTARCFSLVYQALAMIDEYRVKQDLPIARQKALEKSVIYMEANLGRPSFSVETMAPVCDMCPTYFRQQFRRFYGASPKQYLLNARIRKAKDLLATTDLTITKIAEKTGFSSLYYFSKAFKVATEHSPRDYREKGSDVIEAEA